MIKITHNSALTILSFFIACSCIGQTSTDTLNEPVRSCCIKNSVAARFLPTAALPAIVSQHNDYEGMVPVPGGTFEMGADNDEAGADEYPKHKVTVTGFWMDEAEVTNAQFAAFVEATGYITEAERKPDS